MEAPRSHPGRYRRIVAGSLVAALVSTAFALTASPASASGELGATATTTARVEPGATATLSGLSVVNGTGDLQVTLATSAGTLSFPVTAGLTLGFNNAWTGRSAVSFSGSQADINAALAAVQLVAPGAPTTADVRLTVLPSDPDYFFLPERNRFYRFFNQGNITWDNADIAARSTSFRGQPGYLVTIPDAATNDFLSFSIPDAVNFWTAGLGYTDVEWNGTVYPRAWQWAIGADQSPIQGTIFSVCANATGPCDFVDRGSFFDNWAAGEPNACCSPPERYMVTNWSGVAGEWNDLLVNSLGISGYVVEYGGKTNTDDPTLGSGYVGVVTAAADVLISDAATEPAAPSITATPSAGAATLSFAPPATGGEPITGYEVRVDGGDWAPLPTTETVTNVDGTLVVALNGTVSGLVNGTSYSFDVRALNSVGAGDASNTATATPVSVPGAPTITGSQIGDGSFTVSFDPPAEAGGSPITGYTVVTNPGDLSTACAESPCEVSGLANGETYDVAIFASNAIGNGPASDSVTVTPATVPSAPPQPTAVRSDTAAIVTFDAPASNGGAAVTGYLVTAIPGDVTALCAESPCTVEGLTNGVDYEFTVAAVNVAGTGPASEPSETVRPAGVPGAPPSLTATAGDGLITIEFGASDDNGDPVTSYEVSLDGGETWNDLELELPGQIGPDDGDDEDLNILSLVSASSAEPLSTTITGLVNGASYFVSVRAVNAVGPGEATTLSGTVVPSAETTESTPPPSGVPGVTGQVPPPPDNSTRPTRSQFGTTGGTGNGRLAMTGVDHRSLLVAGLWMLLLGLLAARFKGRARRPTGSTAALRAG